VLTGAASIWTTERLLRMWSAPPVGPLQDSLASPSTSGMTRGTILREFHGAERRLACLAQHSMHLVDSESCDAKGADNMAALGAVKGGSTE
jgi:hypothetical protein